MVKTTYLSSLFKVRGSGKASWSWPSCKNPKTESFREGDNAGNAANSFFFDEFESTGTLESWFTNSSESCSFSTMSDDSDDETWIQGLRSDRLFFERDETKSIPGKSRVSDLGYEDCLVMEIDSEDPLCDFSVSMEEMMENYGLNDWECLNDLLLWYLRLNVRKHHGFIIEAFVDLVVKKASAIHLQEDEEKKSFQF